MRNLYCLQYSCVKILYYFSALFYINRTYCCWVFICSSKAYYLSAWNLWSLSRKLNFYFNSAISLSIIFLVFYIFYILFSINCNDYSVFISIKSYVLISDNFYCFLTYSVFYPSAYFFICSFVSCLCDSEFLSFLSQK